MSVKTLLETEIEDQFNELAKTERGSDKYKATVDCAAKLMDRMIEIEKYEDERKNKEDVQQFEHDFKLKQTKEEKRDRIVKNVINAAGVVLPIALTVWGTCVSLKFEEEGSITTPIGRAFINKLFKK